MQFLLSLTLSAVDADGASDATRLVTDLLSNYSMNVRPVQRWTDPVKVKMDITLHEIVELDNRKQSLTTSIWMRLYWNASNLRWNPDEYGGVDQVSIMADQLWTPDITLFQSLKEDTDDRLNLYTCIVRHTGQVAWLLPRIFNTACLLYLDAFPWDRQTCNLTFASWSHDASKLEITNGTPEVDLSFYVPNAEWKLLHALILTPTVRYPCCPADKFLSIVYTLKLQRKQAYYIVNFVFPVGCISAASILVFVVPAESGEKVSLSVTLLLSSTVFLLVIVDMLPIQSESEPQLGWFCCLVILFLAISTAGSALIVQCYYKGQRGHKMPLWL
ncbi:hypothetical protein CAPTEDRAFT_90740, partial [Capitella teleta]